MDALINLLIVWFLVSIPASLIIGRLLARRSNPQPANRLNLVQMFSLVIQRSFARRTAPRLMPGKLAPSRLHLYI